MVTSARKRRRCERQKNQSAVMLAPQRRLVPAVMTRVAAFDSSMRLGTQLPITTLAGNAKGNHTRPQVPWLEGPTLLDDKELPVGR